MCRQHGRVERARDGDRQGRGLQPTGAILLSP